MGGFKEINAVDRFFIPYFKEMIYSSHHCCEICGTTKNLTIHHKEKVSQHPELIFDEENCQVLCRKCHDEVHKKEKQKHLNSTSSYINYE